MPRETHSALVQRSVLKYLSSRSEGDLREVLELFRHAIDHIAKRTCCYVTQEESRRDLEQVGRIEVWRSLEDYDLSKGVSFWTYGYARVWGAMKHWFRDFHPMIHYPAYQFESGRVPVETLLFCDLRTEDSRDPLETVAGPDCIDPVLTKLELKSLMRNLSPIQREFVVFHYYLGYTPSDFARKHNHSAAWGCWVRKQTVCRLQQTAGTWKYRRVL